MHLSAAADALLQRTTADLVRTPTTEKQIEDNYFFLARNAFAQYPAVAALPGGGLVIAWASGVAERTVIRVARVGR